MQIQWKVQAIHQLTQTLHTEAAKLNIKKHSRYIEAGLEEDAYLEVLHELSVLDSCYVTFLWLRRSNIHWG
jgi:hypothetical protein